MSGLFIEPRNEFYLTPYKQGIQIHPTQLNEESQMPCVQLQELMDLELAIYFLDFESCVTNCNITSALVNDYGSIKDILGQSARAKYDEASYQRFRACDLSVLRTKKKQSFEHNMTLQSGINTQAIDYKFPWYNQDNQLQGIFGIAILVKGVNVPSLMSSFDAIAKVNYLISNNAIATTYQPFQSERFFGDIYLSKREYECLGYVMQGMTSKLSAKYMGLSPRTIEHYLENIKQKFSVSNKSDLIQKIIDIQKINER